MLVEPVRWSSGYRAVLAFVVALVCREGLGGLADLPSRPVSCPHHMSALVEARIVAMR